MHPQITSPSAMRPGMKPGCAPATSLMAAGGERGIAPLRLVEFIKASEASHSPWSSVRDGAEQQITVTPRRLGELVMIAHN